MTGARLLCADCYRVLLEREPPYQSAIRDVATAPAKRVAVTQANGRCPEYAFIQQFALGGTVPTLVLYVPTSKNREEGARSFHQMFANAVGGGYAIASSEYQQIRPGWRVVLVDNESQLRAEGTVSTLTQHPPPNDRARNGIRRYDVHLRELVMVDYVPVPPPARSQIAARYRGIQILG